MITAREALQRLIEGNRRFAGGSGGEHELTVESRRHEWLREQAPIAIILGCSDSRVPAEIVFDQGLGDLFVIRVAGNVVAPSQVGSVEFAAQQFGTPLVVVLGHSRCGAVTATLQAMSNGGDAVGTATRNLRSIVSRIMPAVATLAETDLANDPERLLSHAVRANIRHSVSHLRHGSEIVEDLVERGDLRVVGAEYSLETGEVDFFDGLSDEW